MIWKPYPTNEGNIMASSRNRPEIMKPRLVGGTPRFHDAEVHVHLTPTKRILKVTIGGSVADARRAAREHHKGPMFYVCLSSKAITDAKLIAARLTVPEIDQLSRKAYEIIPADAQTTAA